MKHAVTVMLLAGTFLAAPVPAASFAVIVMHFGVDCTPAPLTTSE